MKHFSPGERATLTPLLCPKCGRTDTLLDRLTGDASCFTCGHIWSARPPEALPLPPPPVLLCHCGHQLQREPRGGIWYGYRCPACSCRYFADLQPAQLGCNCHTAPGSHKTNERRFVQCPKTPSQNN